MGWQLFDTKEHTSLKKEDILSSIMKMHCRIQKGMHNSKCIHAAKST